MLADTKRELSGALGVLDKDAGVPLRATYIVNPDTCCRAATAPTGATMSSACCPSCATGCGPATSGSSAAGATAPPGSACSVSRETLQAMEQDGTLTVAVDADFDRFIAARRDLLAERGVLKVAPVERSTPPEAEALAARLYAMLPPQSAPARSPHR